jgi:hypothetical protein
MQSTAFFMLLFAAQPGPAPAAMPAPSAVPAPTAQDAMEAARELLRDAHFEDRMLETALRMSGISFDTIVAAKEAELGEALPEDLKFTVKRIVLEETSRTIEQIKPYALDEAAQVYARHFTADELRELARLKSNPVMMKAEQLAPQLFTELSQIGLKEAAANQTTVDERIKAAIADWLATHAPEKRHGAT